MSNSENINDRLFDAISERDVSLVMKLLESGADPNCYLPSPGENPEAQPTTPLRLVVFCISDTMLEEEDLLVFGEIAKLLLKHGADPKSAVELMELRYGKFDTAAEKSPFMQVCQTIVSAV